MKWLLNNNYHLLSSPKPIAFMTTFKLHQNLMKSELYGSPLDKWGNRANLMGQIWDSDLSGSAFQSPCSCWQCPGWGHWASSTVTGIYYTQTHPHPTPVHDYFLLKMKSKSLPSPFHRAGVETALVWAQWHGGQSRSGRQQVHTRLAHLP